MKEFAFALGKFNSGAIIKKRTVILNSYLDLLLQDCQIGAAVAAEAEAAAEAPSQEADVSGRCEPQKRPAAFKFGLEIEP